MKSASPKLRELGFDGCTKAPPKATKRWLELSRLAVLPVIYLLLVIAEHSGLIDHWRGLDRVQAVADRFGLFYAPDASKPVYPGDAEWKPLIDVIQKYSKVKLRTDKQPQTVARFKATLSAQQETGEGKLTEWTSPSTPFAVIYKHSWIEEYGAQQGVPRGSVSLGDVWAETEVRK